MERGLKGLKKGKPKDEDAIAEADARVKQFTKNTRELPRRAQEIEDVVYDLNLGTPYAFPQATR